MRRAVTLVRARVLPDLEWTVWLEAELCQVANATSRWRALDVRIKLLSARPKQTVAKFKQRLLWMCEGLQGFFLKGNMAALIMHLATL